MVKLFILYAVFRTLIVYIFEWKFLNQCHHILQHKLCLRILKVKFVTKLANIYIYIYIKKCNFSYNAPVNNKGALLWKIGHFKMYENQQVTWREGGGG